MTESILKKYTHIIWDWNGTLVKDTHLCVEILNSMLKARNLPAVTAKQYKDEFDFPVIDYYKKVGFDFSKESFDDIAAEFINQYETHRFSCPLQPNAVKILQYFKSKNFTQSILSAYNQFRLEEVVAHFKLTNYFTHIVGLTDDYAHGKVDAAKQFLEKSTLKSDKTLFIGDTTHDFEVARAINTDCILIADGHQPKEKLLTCNVTVLNTLADFLTL